MKFRRPFSIQFSFQRMLLLMLLLVVLVIPVILIPRVQSQRPPVESKELALRVLLPFTLLLGVVSWRSLRNKGGFLLAELAILSFAAVHVLAALFSGRIGYCLSETWHTWVWLLLSIAAARAVASVADLQKFCSVIGTAGVLCSLYGLCTYFGFDVLRSFYPFQFDENQGGRNFIHSFFGNPEHFGGYAAPVATLALSRVLRANVRPLFRAGWTGAVLLILAALALSGSRGAFLGFGAGAVIISLVQLSLLTPRARRTSLRLLAAAAVAGAVGAAIFSTPNPLNRRDMQLLQRFTDIFNPRSASVRERLLFYTMTADAIGENPIWGAGPGTYRLDFFPSLARLEKKDPSAAVLMASSEIQNRVAEHVHNDYLEFCFELGGVGIAVLLLIVAALFVQFANGLRRWNASQPRHLELIALRTGFFAAAVSILVNAAFSFPLHMSARATLAWVVIGCFLAADRLLGDSRNALAHTTPLIEPNPNSAGEN